MEYLLKVINNINTSSSYWTNNSIKEWCDKNDVYYESTDKRIDLIERIKKAGFR